MSQDHSPTIPMSCHLQRSVLQRVRAGVSDHDTLLCLALILIHLIPIWAFTYFPSQDGPAHLSNATILREYHDRPVLGEVLPPQHRLRAELGRTRGPGGPDGAHAGACGRKDAPEWLCRPPPNFTRLRPSHYSSRRDLSDRPHFPVRL